MTVSIQPIPNLEIINSLSLEPLIFGQKPDKIDSHRENVRVVLYDPKTDTFAIQSMRDEYSVLGGGIEEGDSILETAHKELIEETGYTDFEIVEKLGGQITSYFTARHISQFEYGSNMERVSDGFLAILKSQKNIGPSLTDFEKENGSTIHWMKKEEILEHLQKQVESDFGYYYHLEFFKRAVLVYQKYCL